MTDNELFTIVSKAIERYNTENNRKIEVLKATAKEVNTGHESVHQFYEMILESKPYNTQTQ